MIFFKTDEQIDGIRKSCLLAKDTLKFALGLVGLGVSTLEVNDKTDMFIRDHGAIPAPLNYGGFPKSICTSINNVVCHGIPSVKQIIKNGDIINIDITTILDGYYGDTSAMVGVGKVSDMAELLMKVTREALDTSIRCLGPGKLINDCVGKVIEPYVSKYGFSVVKELGGHGVGLKFHEDPFIFHYDTTKANIILEPGMTFTIEPMVNASKNWRIMIDKNDGWTVYTQDGSLSAQFEHTVLITKTGYQVLT